VLNHSSACCLAGRETSISGHSLPPARSSCGFLSLTPHLSPNDHLPSKLIIRPTLFYSTLQTEAIFSPERRYPSTGLQESRNSYAVKYAGPVAYQLDSTSSRITPVKTAVKCGRLSECGGGGERISRLQTWHHDLPSSPDTSYVIFTENYKRSHQSALPSFPDKNYTKQV
jgi:hypothetical protein